jgi:hypothetical protein
MKKRDIPSGDVVTVSDKAAKISGLDPIITWGNASGRDRLFLSFLYMVFAFNFCLPKTGD